MTDEASSQEREPGDGSMSFIDHLEELRGVILHSAIAAALAAILCWFFSAKLLDLLVVPIRDYGVNFFAPMEAFLTRLKIAGVCGLFVVLPFILFKVYSFVLPGLMKKERRVVTPLLIASAGLFYLGVSFAYLVVIPQVVTFVLGFSTEYMTALIGVGAYFAFVARLCFAFGLVFELPLLVLFLSLLGVVNPRMLLRTWRYALIIIIVFAAVLTPPDVISQLLMAGPVMVLYISSVLVAIVVTRRRRSNDAEAENETPNEEEQDS